MLLTLSQLGGHETVYLCVLLVLMAALAAIIYIRNRNIQACPAMQEHQEFMQNIINSWFWELDDHDRELAIKHGITPTVKSRPTAVSV